MRLIDRRMSFVCSTVPSRLTEFAQRRDGSCNGVSLSRAAPNSLTRSGLFTCRSSDCRTRSATPQKPLRADATVTQSAWLDPRWATGVAVSAGAGGGNRDLRPSLLPAFTASAQLVVDSSVGPHRSQRPWANGRVFSSRLISSAAPVTGPGANPTAMGSGVCRSETEGSSPK